MASQSSPVAASVPTALAAQVEYVHPHIEPDVSPMISFVSPQGGSDNKAKVPEIVLYSLQTRKTFLTQVLVMTRRIPVRFLDGSDAYKRKGPFIPQALAQVSPITSMRMGDATMGFGKEVCTSQGCFLSEQNLTQN